MIQTPPPIRIDATTSGVMEVLRGISALVVASVHAFQIFLIPYFGLGSPGHILTSLLATHAVIIFFVVSGFMICVSVFRHRNADGTFRSRSFAETRILRIYPPLVAAILITILVYLIIAVLGLHGFESYRLGGELAVVRERVAIEWQALPSNLFLLYGAVPNSVPWVLPALSMDGPLWTLAYEWWFYILAYLAARFWNGWSVSTIAPAVLIGCMLLFGGNTLFLWFFLIWLSGFALGFAFLRGGLLSPECTKLIVSLAAVFIAAIFLLGGADVLHNLLNPFSAQTTMVCVGFLITLTIAAALRTMLQRRPSIPLSFTRLSNFSYTLYVVHYPLLLLSYSILHPFTHGHHWAVATLAAATSLIPILFIAWLLSRVVENRAAIRLWRDEALSFISTAVREGLQESACPARKMGARKDWTAPEQGGDRSQAEAMSFGCPARLRSGPPREWARAPLTRPFWIARSLSKRPHWFGTRKEGTHHEQS